MIFLLENNMKKIFVFWLTLNTIVALLLNCKNRQGSPTDEYEQTPSAVAEIDYRSYNLGVIGAFAEVVDIGIKELALSAPLPPEDMDALIEDARRIAAENHVEIYRDDDFLVTDLFPAEITQGKHVLLIYRGRTKQKYLDLKEKKKKLEKTGQYRGVKRQEIARSLGKLLSYPEEKINALLKSNSKINDSR